MMGNRPTKSKETGLYSGTELTHLMIIYVNTQTNVKIDCKILCQYMVDNSFVKNHPVCGI